MRVMIFAALAVLAACASGGERAAGLGDNPFPVERGSAMAPPDAGAGQAAPPEGVHAGGVDFGQWRGADPGVYAPAFQTQIRQRYAGQDAVRMRADLERNGFACEDQNRLDCRIEIMERQCAVDWYVVLERASAEPVAGYETMCLGAR